MATGKLQAQAFLVDGGMSEHVVDYAHYQRLVSAGLEGRRLVDQLISDDWGPPPRSVRLYGRLSDGKTIEVVILYR